MTKLNLDAARAEANEEDHVVTLDGHDYTLPARWPVLATERLMNGEATAAVALLFGEDHVDAVAPLLSVDDLNAIGEQLYGFSEEAENVAPIRAATSPNRAQRRAKSS
jgi:hypothetical protein